LQPTAPRQSRIVQVFDKVDHGFKLTGHRSIVKADAGWVSKVCSGASLRFGLGKL
jgi:hypothetical protein